MLIHISNERGQYVVDGVEQDRDNAWIGCAIKSNRYSTIGISFKIFCPFDPVVDVPLMAEH
jgi:hypothetical protein